MNFIEEFDQKNPSFASFRSDWWESEDGPSEGPDNYRPWPPRAGSPSHQAQDPRGHQEELRGHVSFYAQDRTWQEDVYHKLSGLGNSW